MEEWLRFCENPENLDLLTRKHVQSIPLGAILFVLFHRNKSETPVLNICKRLLELGAKFTSYIVLHNEYFLAQEICFEIFDLVGIKPCPDMYYVACHLRDRGRMSDSFFVKVLDRCYFPTPENTLPLFARTFLISKEWAQLGAISTLHVLRKMVGKDASRIIARVVWSERRNYIPSNRPNKK